jgi:hypothetical protein
MSEMTIDATEAEYTQAVDLWVSAIRAEEALSTTDQSMKQMELWDEAGLRLHDAERTAKRARDLYKAALRKKNYGF